jgi:hypothetical protein
MTGFSLSLIWLIGSGLACILALTWAALAGLAMGRVRRLAIVVLALAALLAVLPSGLSNLRQFYNFSFASVLCLATSLCLLCACLILRQLRCHPALKRSAELGIALSLNLWIALLVTLLPVL